MSTTSQDDPKKPMPRQPPPPRHRGAYKRESIGEAFAKSFIRSIASRLGSVIVRMITGRMR